MRRIIIPPNIDDRRIRLPIVCVGRPLSAPQEFPHASIRRTALSPFEVHQVVYQIDGRADTRALGAREMPIWGNIWHGKDGMPQSEEPVNIQISELVAYIRSVQ